MDPETSAREPRPPAHFRGWFLALVVVGWVSGALLVALRAFVPGLLVLVATAGLLALVDARGLFTLYGRLPWQRTGNGGRALLVGLVVVALPLVVTIYLLVAARRYLIGRRLRTIGRRLRTPRAGTAMARGAVGAESSAPFLSTSTPTLVSAAPVSSRPLATTNESTLPPDGASDLTVVAPPPVPVARHGNRALLAGCLAGGIAVLLLSCGVLVLAAPGRFFAASGGRAPAGGARASGTGGQTPAARAAGTSSTPSATSPATATPTTGAARTPTSTPTAGTTPAPTFTSTTVPSTPTATSGARPAPTIQPTPTPRPEHKHKHKHRRSRRHHDGSAAATPASAGGTASALTFSCAETFAERPGAICFPVPAGQPVRIEIRYWCAPSADASGMVRRTLRAASDDALEWSWVPPGGCSSGVADVVLRAQDGDGEAIEARGTIPFGPGLE